MFLCLTFIDLKKALDFVEAEALLEPSALTTYPLRRHANARMDDIGVGVARQQVHYLRFAHDTVLIIPFISGAERMLADFDDACGIVGLRLNLTKAMSLKNR
ncbi:hypothetical protein ANCCEY_09127 [Ancylostoma ceylanicum]|uniref:Reverse transcriptase domain-containing protein n=1 Tax=Ancylostoma ceylanicum TaxID=53326 RepID=A0A0D6LW00_9BILA|nr:hypothetical protein ANCCEY_09127 [Ancylostoma ceylanicum]